MKEASVLSLAVLALAVAACCTSPAEEDRERSDAAAPADSILNRYPEEEQGPLRSTPRVFFRDDLVRVLMPSPHPERLAIMDPDGHWYYLQDQPLPNPLVPYDEFRDLDSFSFTPSELRAITFIDGEERRLPVFSVAGEYTICLAENLETEPENTLSFETTVYYLREDRPAH